MQQTILIVGGSSGLGRSLCESYLRDGHKVGVIARREHLLNEMEKEFQFNLFTFAYDISNPNCANDLFSIIEQLGGIDKLILTASIVDLNPSLTYTAERETANVNIMGCISVLNTAYHYFTKKNSGHIVLVTSIAAARATRAAPVYSASKAFQSSYLDGIRLKLLYTGKKVFTTELIPGYIDTQMAKGNRLFWVASLEKATKQSKAAIDGRKTKAFITKRWFIIYYIYKFLPAPLYTYLINSNIKLQQKVDE